VKFAILVQDIRISKDLIISVLNQESTKS